MNLRQRAMRIVGTIFGLVVIGAVGIGTYYLVRGVWGAFAALPKEVAVGIVTASATVIAATLAVVIGRQFERKRELDAVHRDKKIPIYDKFIKDILLYFAAASENPPKDQVAPDALEMFRDWQRQIMVWGGPDVVNNYLRWKAALSVTPQTIQVVAQMESLFLAIRKELGHDDRKLEKHALLSLFLSNPELIRTALTVSPNLSMDKLVEVEKAAKEHEA